jgi:hypothetical protein
VSEFDICQHPVLCNLSTHYLTINAPVKCLSCTLENCDICSDKNNKPNCKVCQLGFFLYDSDSDGNFDKCIPCSGTGLYKEMLDSTSGVCHTCSSKFSNCAECSTDGRTCLKCQGNLLLKSSTGDINLLDSCVSTSDCSQTTNYLQTSSNGQVLCLPCSSATPNCFICNGDKSTCSACSNGFYLFDPSADKVYTTCVTCAFSSFYKQADKCMRCEDKFPNCKVCSETGDRCLTCYGQYFLHDSNNDDKFDACLACTDSTQYKASGYATDVSGTGALKFFCL